MKMAFHKRVLKVLKDFLHCFHQKLLIQLLNHLLGTLVSAEAFNGDRYWAKTSNETMPTMDELGETALSNMKDFIMRA